MIQFLIFLQFAFANADCVYKYDHDQTLVEWTAYKFTKRAPVKGHFNKIEVKAKDASNIADVIKSLEFEIDTNSLETGDPARNANITEYFFKKAIPDGKIKGTVSKFEGDGNKGGKLEVKFIILGKTIRVPFDYTVDKDNRITAKSESSVLSFGWKKPLDSLHEACKEQHKDSDGVSKTWPDLTLYATTVLNKDCGDEGLE